MRVLSSNAAIIVALKGSQLNLLHLSQQGSRRLLEGVMDTASSSQTHALAQQFCSGAKNFDG